MKITLLSGIWLLFIAGFTVKSSGQNPPRLVGNIPVYEKFDDLNPRLSVQNDTTYVINFWATWCKPCVQELPYFEQLHTAYNGKKVKVILVSLDFSRQLESKLLPFVQERQLKPEVIALIDSDYNAWIDRISPDWSGAIPVTIVRKGQQKKVILEELPDYEMLDQLVKSFVQQ